MGSMSSIVGDKITKAIEHATKKKVSLIIFTASGGARMQEGIYSLMQMTKPPQLLLASSSRFTLYFLYYPSNRGGVTASFASLGDIIIGEPQALIDLQEDVSLKVRLNKNYRKTFKQQNLWKNKDLLI